MMRSTYKAPTFHHLFIHSCFLLFFLSSKPSESQNQTCHPEDLNSLYPFFQSLSSQHPSLSSINGSSNCCSWPGVSCDKLSRVIGLDLHNMKLRATITPSLANLSQLQWLNLSSNSFSGSVPFQLFQLQQLQRLDLSLNSLSGPIPSNSSLPSIQFFNLSGNLFKGSLPLLPGSPVLRVFDVGYNMLVGSISSSLSFCVSSPEIHVLRLSMNMLSGELGDGFGNCSELVELALDGNSISGNLPEDLFNLPSLKRLYLQENQLSGQLSHKISNLSNLSLFDISFNGFYGSIPNVFNNLMKLEWFLAESNGFKGALPSSLSNLTVIRVLNLRNNSLGGEIGLDFMAMSRLSSLDLGSNVLTGVIPFNISQCKELKTLNLARNNLHGEIPSSFVDMVSLSYLSLTSNRLSNISSALGVLQNCPSLTSLVLTKNFPGGEVMPLEGIQGFDHMEVLVIANCDLSGPLPAWLANCRVLKVVDLSWNRLEGTIPPWFGSLDSLFYLDLSNNSLTGEIPQNLTMMKSLIFRNISMQTTAMPEFPYFLKRNKSRKGLQYNQVSSFPPSLILSYNRLTGPVLAGFGKLRNLHVLDLSSNQLSGNIPDELSEMLSLENLDLSHNNLSGRIPSSLAKLSFLSSFSVAYNNLSGPIPTTGQFLTFPDSNFDGNPGLCGFHLSSPCASEVHPLALSRKSKNKGVIIGMALGIGLGTALLLAILYVVVSRMRYRRPEDRVKEVTDINGHSEMAVPMLVLLFQNKDSKDVSISDILKSTNNFDEANIIGCGGFGLVYKATLLDGRKFAIKKLSGDYGQMEREFQAEVEALSRAQHKNLVLLQGYCRIGNDRILIYSYMENGSLDYWLHEKLEEGATIDWYTRLRIAQGAAMGLAYLHQSCQPHILHRDIKSSNILLDENFEAHLADFGLARLILPYDTHVTTDLVGTLGYIPPEYGQASVATFKGDVYSFGVVLLELLTGRRPVDICKPKGCRDLISWVLQMKNENRVAEVFDPFFNDKEYDSQLMRVLEIACLCLNESPKLRPLTQQLVTWLDNVDINGNLLVT
ncbi:hypothetical protein J5N97_016246 [Dioscorea zingiberensis]|uniref:non-specific serine/threonine protein kinase n=1 Tax=Dioscorea zingiberensis TaxID=325984 RepID=A0A9D5HF06_9LILI|nr:hypothetical protein J5N97_016246 [Dioscorea zingiberensis]